MGTIHKHSTQSQNLDIMTNKNWTCIKMYKNIKTYQKCARTCDSDCSFTRVTELQHSASHRLLLPTSQDLPDYLGPA